MTETTASARAPETDAPAAGPVDAPAMTWRRELAERVAARASALQRQSAPGVRTSGSLATLARLRRAMSRPPGSVPDVWDETIGLVPAAALGRGDRPSAAEQAAHHAMTLFALLRQGSSVDAHVPRVSLGAALRGLSRARASGDDPESEAVRRRFDALLTSSSPSEGAYHLRGLVQLLKSERLGVDFGVLAVDLADLWTPGRADTVRLRWAREYRRAGEHRDATDGASDAAETDDPDRPTTTEERP